MPAAIADARATAPLLGVVLAMLSAAAFVSGQRITTIQLDGTQYFVSRMNPYSPELNYFLAYQYCRSLGLQLASFESREKADSLMQYLRNAGYNKFDYWTSGNRLGTDMLLWMSTGAPFNTTFDYMRRSASDEAALGAGEAGDGASSTPTTSHGPAPAAPAAAGGPNSRAGLGRARSRRPGRQSAEEVATGCVALKSPALDWDTDDCLQLKDFICEQTRCYYYNYGSIPVSTSQGEKKASRPPTTSAAPSPYPSTPASSSSSSTTTTTTASPTAAPLPPSPAATFPDPPTQRPTSSAEDDEEDDDAAREDESPDESFNFASRSFPEKDAVANVVYVTAVGVDSLLNATASPPPTLPKDNRNGEDAAAPTTPPPQQQPQAQPSSATGRFLVRNPPLRE